MDAITATVILLMATALVIGLSGRRMEQTSAPPSFAPPMFTQPQSGSGVAGLLVILGIFVLLLAFAH
jgi:hypothetical protein